MQVSYVSDVSVSHHVRIHADCATRLRRAVSTVRDRIESNKMESNQFELDRIGSNRIELNRVEQIQIQSDLI